MSDTFSFKAARPAGAHAPLKGQTVSDATQGPPGPDVVHDPDGHPVGPTRRKRRTRAEIEATAPTHVNSGDELVALKACLKQLRGLSDQSRLTVMTLLKAMFE